MVMGPTHAMSGAAVGLLVAQALPASAGGITTAQEAFVYAGLAAGAALLPDLDSPPATISRSFGPLSQGLSHVVENASQAVVNMTSTHKDDYCNNGHRKLTHTFVFAIAMGLGASALIGLGGKKAAIGLLFVLLGLAIRGLVPEWSKKNDWLVVTAVSAVLAWVAWTVTPVMGSGVVMGSAVTVGILTHLAGDFITKQGIPALAPLRFHGRGWYDFGLPSPMRISASGMADQLLLAAFTLLTVYQAFMVATGRTALPTNAAALLGALG